MNKERNPIRIYCAGSLREVLTEIGDRFRTQFGRGVEVTAGPSGLLRERIERGDRPDVFASANREHPRRLGASGLAGPTVVFARNQICVIGKAELNLTEANLLDRLLDPGLRLGAPAPIHDPGGDYAWEMFRKAEEIRPGSFERLAGKARQIVGGPAFPPVKPGVLSLVDAFEDDQADVFVVYRTTALLLLERVSGLAMTDLPPALRVEARFGLTLVAGACPEAGYVALYILAPEGQRVFAEYGFIPASELS